MGNNVDISDAVLTYTQHSVAFPRVPLYDDTYDTKIARLRSEIAALEAHL